MIISGTGGGSYKYEQMIREELGCDFDKVFFFFLFFLMMMMNRRMNWSVWYVVWRSFKRITLVNATPTSQPASIAVRSIV